MKRWRVGTTKPRVRPRAVRLITPDEAIERIGLFLVSEHDLRQRLVSIAGVAIAAVISLDEDAAEIEEIDGLQESVNRALFV
jgi:hypothetical protein